MSAQFMLLRELPQPLAMNKPLSYWLDKLAEIGLDDEIDPDDFGPLTLTPGFLERVARFADKARPIGSASQLLELQCSNLLPEGTAFDSKRDELLISERTTAHDCCRKGNVEMLFPKETAHCLLFWACTSTRRTIRYG